LSIEIKIILLLMYLIWI